MSFLKPIYNSRRPIGPDGSLLIVVLSLAAGIVWAWLMSALLVSI